MATPTIPPGVATLTGPALIGFAGQWGLFGCSSVQVYLYYLHFPKDGWKLKTLVYGLYIWDALQTFLVTDFVFGMLASGWGNVAVLESYGISWFALPFMNAIASTAVQCFYAWRIYALSKSIPLAVVVVALALLEGVSGIAFAIIIRTKVKSLADVQSKTLVVTTVCLMGSASCDMLICVAMLFLLNRARKATGFNSTEKILSRLISLIVGGGVLTTSMAILDAVLYLVYQHNNFHIAPNATLAKLYTNALMVLLNSRATLGSLSSNVQTAGAYGWTGDTSQSRTTGTELSFDRDAGHATTIPMNDFDFGKNKSVKNVAL